MFSFNSLDSLQYYEDLETDEGPFDIFTAASVGDIPHFLKYQQGENLPSILSICNDSGWTPLMYACSRGHDVLVYHLLHYKASKKCKSRSGVTPLMLAISSGDFSTFEYVFDVDDMELKDDKSWTPLFYAVYFHRQKILEFLLQKGANPNVVDTKSNTPLMMAIKSGYETAVQILLKAREKANVWQENNKTLLNLAASSNNPEISKLISHHCMQVDIKNKNICDRLTPNSKLLYPSNINRVQYSPSPDIKKRSLFNFKLNKSYAYSPNKKLKSSAFANLSLFQEKSINFNKIEQTNDVEMFLKLLGLEKYWPIFKDEEVDFETLLTLGDHNLKELGIMKYGPRRKIYLAIQQYKQKH